ncbi:MAG: hypothetical protein RIG68_21890 [Imperialibacter sp.]|uniref:hypothetical protein n=1 Tax=Imperialibacter sp. TaxID=2038411 RepID=UPI0032F07345
MRLIYLLILAVFVGCAPQELPHPALSAEEVVHINFLALQQNDSPELDHGIEIAWNFASPTNKENTGPIERFNIMVHNENFRPLINCRHFEIRTHFQEKSEAEFLVLIEDSEGEVHSYMVSLSLQKYPPYDDCWMIDAVIPMRLPSKDGPRVAFFSTFNYWPAPFL